MTSTRPPIPPDGEPESEPGPPPTLPGSGSWGDTDIGAAAGPAMLFAARPAAPSVAESRPTMGHIGRYALKYPIGTGGQGAVYAAHDPLLSRLIAIKTLNLEIPNEERAAFNALFLHEARAAAGLSHPHIVTVFDAGINEVDGESSAYIAMELLKGRDLRQLREEGWRPTPAQSAQIVRRVADALAYAHSKGIVHRDIKPANIFMVGRTQPRVLDFGIARVTHQIDSAGAPGDIAAGSPYYMSPEQVRQQPVDRRSDVFSLGVVFYELLTGEKPFKGANLDEITRAVLEHVPPPAFELDRKLPQSLSEIATRAMEKNPEHRFRSARAFSRELRHWLDEHPQDADAAVPVTPAAATPARRRWPLATAIAGAVLCAALAGGWFLTPGSDEAPAATAATALTPALAQAPAAPAPAPEAEPDTAGATAAASDPTPAAASLAAPPAPGAPPSPPAAEAKAAAPAPAAVLAPPRTGLLATAAGVPVRAAAKETPKDRRAREAREREVHKPAAPATPLPTGVVRIAVSPWGQVEVDGAAAGTAPPLNELALPEGRHQITLRNEDFPPFSATITVTPGQPVTVKHRFGS